MIPTFANEIGRLLGEGICLIPAKSKEKFLLNWKEVVEPLDFFVLMDYIQDYGASQVAIKLGAASGRMICLDVDVKYNEGFDAIFFSDLQNLYPEIWGKLWREKTPSGGYHLYYRVDGDQELPGNRKLASRMATEDEIAVKPSEKKKCFLEIKSEGGLSHCYPTPGYEYVAGSLNTLTWEEHSSLYTLSQSYNSIIEKVEKIRVTKDVSNFYSENPYECFDASPEAVSLLLEEGWDLVGKSGKYDYYGRPGRAKKDDVHASFNHGTRLYKIWTTSSDLEQKSYSPSNFLCAVKFDGDKKKLYAFLVAKGYGKIKPEIEENLIKRLAVSKKPAPANLSEEGRRKLEEESAKVDEQYPYGIFWETMKEGGIKMNKERVIEVAQMMGFCNYNSQLCYVSDHFIEYTDQRFFLNRVKAYISREEESLMDILDSYETTMQKYVRWIIDRLREVPRNEILFSSKHVSYKGYKNGYLEIDENGWELMTYDQLQKKIWKHQIQDRDFVEGDWKSGLYFEYLRKAVGISAHSLSCIGYYAHDYKSTETSYIVVLCEQVEDARKGGGSGKNIFTNLLQFTTTLLNKPGKNAKFDDTLLRTWKGQRVLSLNDLDKKFDYMSLKELSSGEGEVGKKFVQEITIENVDMPKFICNTNFAFDANKPGLRRRMVPLEFTDFFSVCGGVDVHFKKTFPSNKTSTHDWVEEDWIGYDNLIIHAIQTYMSQDCKLKVPILSDGGWIKQFEERFSSLTFQFIQENIENFIRIGKVSINRDFNPKYEQFCTENKIDRKWQISSQKMNEALESYCEKYEIEFIKTKNMKNSQGQQENFKIFSRKTTAVPEYSQIPEKIELESNEDELPF